MFWRGKHTFSHLEASFIQGLPQHVVGNQYYVSANDGVDSSSRPYTNPDYPAATIQAAITRSNATIDWSATPKKYNIIWVEPGVYAENLTPAYYCWIIGLGIRGTDTMAEVRPASGSELTGTFLGTVLSNLRFEHLEASKPVFDLGICNNSKLLSCQFALGADVDGVAAIDTENCTHLWVEDCDVESGMGDHTFDYFIYHRGGADKYAHNCRYLRNRAFVETCGIYVASNCTPSQSIAEDNDIIVSGTGTGIDGNGGGADSGSPLVAIKNRIIVAGAGDAIHGLDAGNMLHNETNVDGTFAYETA
jgi:hypothetical protein